MNYMGSIREFRKDIQGLRGLAVGLVVLEHATPVLPGGYIGVDVFFVISGFVITQLLLREIETRGSINLVEFYSRRVRRLIPALGLVLSVTLVGSLFILSPGLEQEKAVSAALSATFFVANIRYIFEGGYFFLQADPFRHLWSLGVEEQFYLFYPLLFVLLLKIAHVRKIRLEKLSISVFATLMAVSFLLASILAEGFRILPLPTRMSFFGTPFRLWELIAGGVLAVVVSDRGVRLSRTIWRISQVVGTALILLPAVMYDSFTVFPGVAALAPVAGTVVLIAIGTTQTHAASPLTWGPLTYIGDISYGLYLWHWPMIVFSEKLFPSNPLAIVVAVAVSVAASIVQLKLVELPIRDRSGVNRRAAWRLFGITAISIVVLAGLVFSLSRSGLGLDLRSRFEPMPRISDGCSFEESSKNFGNQCTLENGSSIRLLLVGDSQAGALADAFVLAANDLGASYKLLYGNSCPVHIRPNELRDSCRDLNEQLPGIVAGFRPTVIVAANASDLYVTRGGFGKPDTQLRRADGSLPRNYEEALENWILGLREVLQSDWRGSTPVVYVQMIPVAPVETESLLKRGNRLANFSLDDGFDRNMVVAKEKGALFDLRGVTLLDPADVLCVNRQCILTNKGNSLYADAYHLNPRGAELLAPRIIEMIREALGN
jgi:peptidoglycan/LPS O-acetylase OafA/YrhL